MKDIISVNIATDLNHTYECDTNILGREGEGNTTQLELTIPKELSGCTVYLDFEKPNGETLRTAKLTVKDGVATYDVSQYILEDDGEIKVQAVFVTESGQIWKSSIKTYFSTKSINADDDIPEKEDFIAEAQKILDEFSAEVETIIETLAKDETLIGAVANNVEDARWINTITGTKLKFFVGKQAEYDALSDATKQNLFAIITDDTTKDDIEELQEGLDLLGEAFAGHTHNGLLCSVAFTSGTARLPEADAKELKNKMCFLVFEETTDLSKRLHSGVFYIKADINSDSATQPEHTYSVDYGGCGQYRLAYYPTATSTESNMKLWDKDGELANVNGTLSIYKMGVI